MNVFAFCFVPHPANDSETGKATLSEWQSVSRQHVYRHIRLSAVISNEIAFANLRQHDLCPLQWGYFALKCRGLKKKGNSLESVWIVSWLFQLMPTITSISPFDRVFVLAGLEPESDTRITHPCWYWCRRCFEISDAFLPLLLSLLPFLLPL